MSCHRPGEVAPMSLITFKDVRPWASAIREKVASRVMPPWHADRQYGTFRNEQSLTQREIDTIVKWVERGRAARAIRRRMPALPKFPEGWQIGTPDAVFEMPDGRIRSRRRGDDRIPVLRGADQLHRGPVDAGRRSASRRSRARASHHRLREGAEAAARGRPS